LRAASAARPAVRPPEHGWPGGRSDHIRDSGIATESDITTTPNELCAPIHNRMPVILPPSRYAAWLGEEPADADELGAMLQPYPSKLMRAYRISPEIGNVRNEGAELIEPLAA
jgi:putative SOS response-associated peptidase YedK